MGKVPNNLLHFLSLMKLPIGPHFFSRQVTQKLLMEKILPNLQATDLVNLLRKFPLAI
jgi:hypothetical protein